MDNLESIDKSKLDRFKAKLIERSEGNIRLLGELFNYQVLNCKMIMECVDILFSKAVKFQFLDCIILKVE